ncbi:MAG: thiamine pyrophosphate-binding protein, partial [Eubacteriales bacterium]|nr:thiamine pyrophosphate-binding protein [Eubacteriales bacterium]
MKQILLGNEAIAAGAHAAGVKVISSYPGTPSTEITEAASQYEQIACEWAPNEKVGLEVAVGASLAGARAMSCMKHVGLNVAADPLFTSSYTGVNGGLVVVVADDPGMHSSQNEQDSRQYARAAKLPMFEPADSQECQDMTRAAFELSEQFDTPVLVRLT